MKNEKTIRMQFPSDTGNRLYDGKIHEIIPERMALVGEQAGDQLFVLSFFDVSLGKEMLTYVLKRNNRYYKIPLNNYSTKDILLMRNILSSNSVDINLLPDVIPCSQIMDNNDFYQYFKEAFSGKRFGVSELSPSNPSNSGSAGAVSAPPPPPPPTGPFDSTAPSNSDTFFASVEYVLIDKYIYDDDNKTFAAAYIHFSNGRKIYVNSKNDYMLHLNAFARQEGVKPQELEKNSEKVKIHTILKDIDFIEIYTQDGNFVNAKVKHNNGSIEYITNIDDLKIRLNLFALQLSITLEELLNDSTKVVEIKITSKKEESKGSKGTKKTEDTKLPPFENDKEEEEETTKTTKGKGRFKRALITLTSVGTVIAMILAGDYILNRKKSSENKEVKTRVEDATTGYDPNLPITNALVEDATSVVSIDYISNRLIDIVARLNNGERVSEDDLQYAMDEINQLSYSNIPGFSSLVSGQPMYGSKKPIDFYKLFPVGSYEYRIIKEFSLLRNDIDNNSFVLDSELTTNEVNRFLNKSLGYIFNGDTDTFRNKNMNFYSLSPIARYIIVDMAMNMLTTNPNYTGIINNQRCNYNALVNEFSEVFNTVTDNLVNSSTRRK